MCVQVAQAPSPEGAGRGESLLNVGSLSGVLRRQQGDEGEKEKEEEVRQRER